jgi:hypothetical protein
MGLLPHTPMAQELAELYVEYGKGMKSTKIEELPRTTAAKSRIWAAKPAYMPLPQNQAPAPAKRAAATSKGEEEVEEAERAN